MIRIINFLLKKKERFENKNNDLIKENSELKEKVNKLKPIVVKFTLSFKKL